jgi:hypothetical protein
MIVVQTENPPTLLPLVDEASGEQWVRIYNTTLLLEDAENGERYRRQRDELLSLLRRFYAATYGVESTSALCQLDFEQARQAIARATGE